jgi:hypothetical protein
MNSPRGSRSWRLGWLPWAALVACLNPQPDDTPMDRPNQDNGMSANLGPGVTVPEPEAPLYREPDQESPQSTPPLSGSTSADAGAPLLPADGGTLEQADLVEGDAGISD